MQDKEPVKFHAVEFKIVIKSLGLVIKCLSMRLLGVYILQWFFWLPFACVPCSESHRMVVCWLLCPRRAGWRSTWGKRVGEDWNGFYLFQDFSFCSFLCHLKWLLYCELFHLVSTPLKFDTAEINVTSSIISKLLHVMKVRIPTAALTLLPEEKANQVSVLRYTIV